MKKKLGTIALGLAIVLMLTLAVSAVAQEKQAPGSSVAMQSGGDIWNNYLKALGWAIVASIGFAVGVGLGIVVFDLISVKIDEWEEIKKGNWSVAMILTSLIVMVGLIIIKVI